MTHLRVRALPDLVNLRRWFFFFHLPTLKYVSIFVMKGFAQGDNNIPACVTVDRPFLLTQPDYSYLTEFFFLMFGLATESGNQSARTLVLLGRLSFDLDIDDNLKLQASLGRRQ